MANDLTGKKVAFLGAGKRELCRADTRDEISAADLPRILHRLEHVVHGAEPAADAFGPRDLAREDPQLGADDLARLQELLGEQLTLW